MPQGPWTAYQKDLVRSKATQYGIDPNLADAIVHQESGYDTDAVSSAGAKGMMQLMPGTARELGVTDPHDPTQNIDAGMRYFKQQLDRFGGDSKLALAAYNAGPNAVARAGNRIPNISETQNYVSSIMARAATTPVSTDQGPQGQTVHGPWERYSAQPSADNTWHPKHEGEPVPTAPGFGPEADKGAAAGVTRAVMGAINLPSQVIGAFTEPETPEEKAFHERPDVTPGEAALSQIPGGLAIRRLITDPYVALGGPLETARERARKGEYGAAAIHAGLGAIPFAGPIAESLSQRATGTGEFAGKGADPTGAGAEALAGMGLAHLGGKAIGKVIGDRPWLKPAYGQERTVFKQPHDLLRDAVGKPAMDDASIQHVGNELKEYERTSGQPVKDWDTAVKGLSERTSALNQEEQRFLGNVGNIRMPQVNFDEFTARAKAIPDQIRIQSPDVYTKMVQDIREEILSRGGQGPTINDLNSVAAGLNKELATLYDARAKGNLKPEENPRIQDLEAQRKTVTGAMYDFLNQNFSGSGEVLRAIKERKGAIINFESYLKPLEGTARSQAAQSMAERFANRAERIRILHPGTWRYAVGRSEFVNNLIAEAMRKWDPKGSITTRPPGGFYQGGGGGTVPAAGAPGAQPINVSPIQGLAGRRFGQGPAQIGAGQTFTGSRPPIATEIEPQTKLIEGTDTSGSVPYTPEAWPQSSGGLPAVPNMLDRARGALKQQFPDWDDAKVETMAQEIVSRNYRQVEPQAGPLALPAATEPAEAATPLPGGEPVGQQAQPVGEQTITQTPTERGAMADRRAAIVKTLVEQHGLDERAAQRIADEAILARGPVEESPTATPTTSAPAPQAPRPSEAFIDAEPAGPQGLARSRTKKSKPAPVSAPNVEAYQKEVARLANPKEAINSATLKKINDLGKQAGMSPEAINSDLVNKLGARWDAMDKPVTKSKPAPVAKPAAAAPVEVATTPPSTAVPAAVEGTRVSLTTSRGATLEGTIVSVGRDVYKVKFDSGEYSDIMKTNPRLKVHAK